MKEMSILADLLRTIFERNQGKSDFKNDQDERSIIELCNTLITTTSETSALFVANKVLTKYSSLSDADKLSFFQYVSTQMTIDPDLVRRTLEDYEKLPSRETYQAFSNAAEPSRQELVRRLNQPPGATKKLVEMRADLLRLEPRDRRCFAFFHPAIPDEPLIFVEVALTKGTPTSIQELLSEAREEVATEQIDTAVFYSISNCQAGLANVSLGNFLIKQVASDLSLELEGLKKFITLSPIPGLGNWLRKTHPNWNSDDEVGLRSLAAHYLINEKSSNNLPLDPVARFHLGNGAIVEKVHVEADNSENGKLQSLGCMVNYLYDLEQVTKNHEEFVSQGKVMTSREVMNLAKSFKI